MAKSKRNFLLFCLCFATGFVSNTYQKRPLYSTLLSYITSSYYFFLALASYLRSTPKGLTFLNMLRVDMLKNRFSLKGLLHLLYAGILIGLSLYYVIRNDIPYLAISLVWILAVFALVYGLYLQLLFTPNGRLFLRKIPLKSVQSKVKDT